MPETKSESGGMEKEMSEREIIPRHNGKSMTDIWHMLGAEVEFVDISIKEDEEDEPRQSD